MTEPKPIQQRIKALEDKNYKMLNLIDVLFEKLSKAEKHTTENTDTAHKF
ncbi:hypothetical protein LCGC14_3105910 [marine sediment metagenome]|uniref:Uncharacterized protein n=1 Tax=marine sediment metagenome TaxID=412755 RepID=A0A0F8YWE5_9ZZZZ